MTTSLSQPDVFYTHDTGTLKSAFKVFVLELWGNFCLKTFHTNNLIAVFLMSRKFLDHIYDRHCWPPFCEYL